MFEPGEEFKVPDVFADIFNVLLFRGKKVLREENIADGPTESQYKDAADQMRGQARDCMKYDRENLTTLAVLGIENQSGIDDDMVFRVKSNTWRRS